MLSPVRFVTLMLCSLVVSGLAGVIPLNSGTGGQAPNKRLIAPFLGPDLFFANPGIAAEQPTGAKPAVPKPAADLRAGTSTYRGWVDADGKKTNFVATRTIEEQGDAWFVTETAKQPEGEATDETVLAKGSLVVRKRKIMQPPFEMDFEVKDGKAVGKMRLANRLRPILVDLGGGELFADGAGKGAVVAALPLAEGYQTSFRNLEVPSLNLKAMQLKVVGSERVTVPAGNFDTFKVQITTDKGEQTTFWIAKSPRRAVKSTTKSPEVDGGTITTELQK